MSKRRPTIYIGLGGTGIKAIAHAKKLYEEEFGIGQVPPEIAFLAVDFDAKEVEDGAHPADLKGDFLQLVTAVNPLEHYMVGREQNNAYKWMFKGNAGYIDKNINNGAKQVRTTGRLYTEIVIKQIQAKITSCYNRVQSIAKSKGYNQAVDVHLVMSLAGGTGAGSFLTVALLLDKEFHGKINLFGYGVLHGVFKAMDTYGNKTPRVIANAYSAIVDLDYLLHASPDNPVQVALGPTYHKLTAPLFNEFYVVNNETQDGKVVESIKQLSEVIGTCLYVSGNDLGNKKSSLASNVGWELGNFNVKTKRGWVYGLVACQVVYKGAQLAQVFALKASRELMRQMQAVGDDIQQTAINWTEEVDIREDGEEYNLLTNRIYSPSSINGIKSPLLDVNATDNANKTEVNKYLSTLQPDFPDAQAEEKIKKDLMEKLDKKISTIVDNVNGVGNAISFLNNLKKLCEGYKGEMEIEEKTLNQLVEKTKESLDTKAWNEYNDSKKGFFTINKDSKNQDLLDEIVGISAKKVKMHIHEAKRRNVAYNVYVALLSKIDELINKVELLNQSLRQLDEKFENELLSVQRSTASSLVFEYDLSHKERVNLSVSKDEVDVPLFINSLQKSLLNIELEDLEKIFIDYTLTLQRAKDYRNTLINDVIRELSTEEYVKLKEEIASKSNLLLRLDGRGQTIAGDPVRDKMVSNFMIATYDDGQNVKTRLAADTYFMSNIVNKDWVTSSAEVMKQKIIFYRFDGAILPYCIEAFDPYTVSSEYENQIKAAMASGSITFNPHFDAEIYEDMIKNDFKLKPEMKNEALFYWVCGQIFGWTTIPEEEKEMRRDEKGMIIGEDKNAEIQMVEHPKYIANIKKKYYYWDEEAMEGKMQKWQPIDGAGTSRRDTAFNYFKSVILPNKKELFHQLIKQEFSKMGNEYWRLKIEQIAKSGIDEYINRLLCSNKISTTYFQDNGGEIQVIREEFDFIQKQLYTILSTLK